MPDQRPNIVLIFADQMRWDCMSIVGHPVVQTPHLDELAHRGTLFTAAYSSCPSCVAARAAIFTGRTPSDLGRLGYRDQVPWRYGNMMAQVIGDAGYQTHCVGKTHFYPQRAHLGFHSLDSSEGHQNFDGLYVNDYHEWLRERTNGRINERDHGVDGNSWVARPSHLPEELHTTTWTVTKGVEFLRRRDKTRPFFLNLSFHRPHPPIDPPQAFYDMYRDRPVPPVPVGGWAGEHDVPVTDVNAWRGRLPATTLDHTRRAYFAQIAHIDSQIGRFLLAMRHHKVGPTAFLFTSDHGEMLGDHHLFRKTYAYQGSAAVPFVLSGVPGGAAGHVSDAPVALQDVYPTLLELAGADVPDGTEGRSLLPVARDPGAPPAREYVHGEHSPCYGEDTGMQFLADGKEKYVWFTKTGREQLFDLCEDPQETRDLAGDPSAKERLEKWRQRMVAELAPREQDGLSDGKRLLPGKNLPAVRPELLDGE